MPTTSTTRRHVNPSPERRVRSRRDDERPARRARADVAIINQWLLEQTDRTTAPAPSSSTRPLAIDLPSS